MPLLCFCDERLSASIFFVVSSSIVSISMFQCSFERLHRHSF
ncbi:hypothetical protein X975_26631, partial [Stegodyphus mimosarum]